jgi:hypothetical protein
MGYSLGVAPICLCWESQSSPLRNCEGNMDTELYSLENLWYYKYANFKMKGNRKTWQ